MDYLVQSLVFLSQVEQNLYYWKWFVIAYHGAIYSFMLLVLQKVGVKYIYSKQPIRITQRSSSDPFDGHLIGFLGMYRNLKNNNALGINAFVATDTHDISMEELNNKLRNQFLHFLPMTWGSEAWYPARVCYPLLDVLRFCLKSEGVDLDQTQKEIASTYIDSLDRLLTKHKV